MLLSIGDRVKVKIPVTDPATRERTGEVVQVPAKVVGFYQDAQTQQKQVEVKYPNDTITVARSAFTVTAPRDSRQSSSAYHR